MIKEGVKEKGAEAGSRYVKWFSELDRKSGSIAGGKGANLGEMCKLKMPVPPGFVITAQAYSYFIEKAGLVKKIKKLVDSIDVDDTTALEEKAKEIREMIIKSEMPEDLRCEILDDYENLSVDKAALEQAKGDALDILKRSQEPIFVAVRSSATTEDLETASFAGQQETFLNIKGNFELLEAVKKCFASLFTARAIYYRNKKGFEHEKSLLAVIVQKMIDADKSGVIFSDNPMGENDNVIIEAVFGLGEGIVSGKIKPDHYEIERENLEITKKQIADKKIALTRNSQGDTEQVNLTEERSKSQVLTDSEIKRLADYSLKLEEHYKTPQDIEFAIESKQIYIVQTRPVTTTFEVKMGEIKGEILLSGLPASPGVASGRVKIIRNLDELSKIEKGDILVTKMTNPDMVVTMQKSAGIVTDEGGITSHAAIVSREMGIPAVVGTGNATEKLEEGQLISVDGTNGKIYSGESEKIEAEIRPIIRTNTKIKVIIDLPEFAQRAAETRADSIGLVRIEGIIATSGKHPNLFIKEKREEEYIRLLFEGISKISEPFKEIWIRTSDIRSDEYKNLEGAPQEPEANPMLGMHGIRAALKNKKILESELKAIKKCEEKYPNKQFGIMLPLIISVNEVREAKKIISEVGVNLDNFKFGVMIETPAACQIIEELCDEGIDFISFGTNDLTQFTLALDRNNEDVQYLYDEMHPAVLAEMKQVIKTCKEKGVETSICGQAGSNKKMVRFLVEQGIDSIAVNADAAHDISIFVDDLEKIIEKKEPEPIPIQPKSPKSQEEGEDTKEKIEIIEKPEEEKQPEIQQEILYAPLEPIEDISAQFGFLDKIEGEAGEQGDTQLDIF